MFGRKKKDAAPQRARITASPQRICVYGADGVLYDGALTALNLPEKLIIELSIEFFDDPEPCQIHRGAVMRRGFMELSEVLGENSETAASDLPDAARRYLCGYENIARVRMYREEAGA